MDHAVIYESLTMELAETSELFFVVTSREILRILNNKRSREYILMFKDISYYDESNIRYGTVLINYILIL